ncbi:hypothetical protein D9758_013019 [Tetrapyrgos nigripes]|uniref:Calmodulin n=1 Tax=Tetrapyrgos nigripes TaxID=182062 RepID=A0A8H5FHP7_9AGAR|nr:hypothetical protein D9758_013019 [Tetrapyrgos nigripes]
MAPKPARVFLTLFLLSFYRCSSDALKISRSPSYSPTSGQLSLHDAFQIIDSDNDEFITVSELYEVAGFHWSDIEAANRARITFNLAHPIDFVSAYDTDGDGQLSKEEFAVPMQEVQLRTSSECRHLSERLDTCKTSQTLKCSAYLNAAEYMCRLDHRNIIEQCILNSPCASICDCVAQAEKAAHGKATLVLQYPDGSQEFSSDSLLVANSTEVGHPQKRFFFLFLGLVIATILNIAVTSALISISEIQQQTGVEVGFMNFNVWDSGSGDPPPSCSVYVFWSTSCGAILSSKARGCSDGGTRLYQNSCKDHFRYGSRGCGFLDLGCRSLCYAINDNGCPCSIFDRWTEQDNIDYPGNDIETLHVAHLSDCRTACASSPQCLAFVVPPSDGTENQINCFLKGELGSFKKSTGSVSFLKILANEKTCPNSLVGPDGDIGIFDRRREMSLPKNALIPRISDDDINGKAFPFDRTDATFLIIARFLQALYQAGSLWINREQVQRTSLQATLTPIGNNQLTPLAGEPVASADNPRWRVSDGWRVINVYRNLLNNGGNSNTPVASFVNGQPTSDNDDLNRAVMPTALRTLFIANEQTIINGQLPWAGADGGSTAGYPGVQAVHGGGSNLGYYQGGSIGPMPLEAAFIMATQLAGINFRTMAQRIAQEMQDSGRPRFRALHWLNAIVPRGPGDPGIPTCLREYREGREFTENGRILGFMSRDGDATGGPREGFYVIIDVDGQNNVEANPDRNVLVFAVHTIDPHSRINVPNQNTLRNLQYTTFDPNASPDARPDGPSRQAQQRFFAHAHAGLLTWAQIRDFMNQGPDIRRNQVLRLPDSIRDDSALILHKIGLYLQLDLPRLWALMAAGGPSFENFLLDEELDIGPYCTLDQEMAKHLEKDEDTSDDDREVVQVFSDNAEKDLAAYAMVWFFVDLHVAFISTNTKGQPERQRWVKKALRRFVNWSTATHLLEQSSLAMLTDRAHFTAIGCEQLLCQTWRDHPAGTVSFCLGEPDEDLNAFYHPRFNIQDGMVG